MNERHRLCRMPHALRAILALTFILALVAHAMAHSYHFGDISVGHVWAPPASGSEGDVYGPLLNSGEREDRLVEVTTPAAQRVEIRFGNERAAHDFIELPPQKPVSLASWGYRLHLLGLTRPLSEGDSFELTLTFEKAGSHTVEVFVESKPTH
jgi:copper(I)-binding protein